LDGLERATYANNERERGLEKKKKTLNGGRGPAATIILSFI
jgi:hypothetical protein